MNDKDKQMLLREKAHDFLRLLTHYAEFDKDAYVILDDVKDFVDKIDRGEISVPHKFPWEVYFFRGDNNLGVHYDLMNAAAKFSIFIEDREWMIKK